MYGAVRVSCGKPVKPGTIAFGQSLPEGIMQRAEQLVQQCDLLLCIGTSLVVSPANLIPAWAVERGIPLVLINKSPTSFDDYATVVIRDACGALSTRLMPYITALTS